MINFLSNQGLIREMISLNYSYMTRTRKVLMTNLKVKKYSAIKKLNFHDKFPDTQLLFFLMGQSDKEKESMLHYFY